MLPLPPIPVQQAVLQSQATVQEPDSRGPGVCTRWYKLFNEVFKHPRAFNFKPWELNVRSESGKKHQLLRKGTVIHKALT